MRIEKEPEGKYISAKNLKLHYHEFGSGYPLICIHGAGPGASGWSNFKGNIDAFGKHYRTILFDMPQFGKSSLPRIHRMSSRWNAFVKELTYASQPSKAIRRIAFGGDNENCGRAVILRYSRVVSYAVLQTADTTCSAVARFGRGSRPIRGRREGP